jgi:hypothetical protein
MVSALAKELAHLAAGHPPNSMFREPIWTTPNRIALELPSMRLRKFSEDEDEIATLICAPLALHDATLTDFAPDHSSRCGAAVGRAEECICDGLALGQTRNALLLN